MANGSDVWAKHVATERQLAANRSNAQRSTGPRTDAGKSNSRRNALKHGLSAKKMLLDGEDANEFDELRNELFEELKPIGPVEELLVGTLVETWWRLRRAPEFEEALMSWTKHRLYKPHDSRYDADRRHVPDLGQREQLGRAVDILLLRDYFSKLSRYERHLTGQIERTLDRLQQYRNKHSVALPAKIARTVKSDGEYTATIQLENTKLSS